MVSDARSALFYEAGYQSSLELKYGISLTIFYSTYTSGVNSSIRLNSTVFSNSSSSASTSGSSTSTSTSQSSTSVSTSTSTSISTSTSSTSQGSTSSVAFQANCADYDPNGNCLRCAYFFYRDQMGMCRQVSPYCRTFNDQNGQCLTCYPGYGLKLGACVVS